LAPVLLAILFAAKMRRRPAAHLAGRNTAMTPRVERLHQLIVGKQHHAFRREVPFALASGFSAHDVSPTRRVGLGLAAVLQAERPVILEGERICLLRTVPRLPALLTPEEWDSVRGARFLHEQGKVCNLSPDYGSTIAVGLSARREEVALRLARCREEMDRAGVDQLETALLELGALLDLAERYRTEAQRLGRSDLAATLERVPRHGATTFLQALQSFRFLHFALWAEGEYHNTVGRLDQLLWPYLEADLAAGRLDEAEALDLLEEFFLSFNRDSDLYPGVQQGDNGQSLVLGGVTRDGRDGWNRLSALCLQASKSLRLIDPKVNVRVSARTPPEVYELGTELTQEGLGFPQYSNDDVVIPGLVDLGYRLEDARDYVVAACWEFIIPGVGTDIPNIAALSFPAALQASVREALATAGTFDAFLDAVKARIRAECQRLATSVRGLWTLPAPFMSLLFDGCVERARDVAEGCRYVNYGFHGTGLSTAVDSLAAIRRYVFEERSLSPAALLQALDSDFQGEEALLARLRYEAPKMGNGDAAVDALATELLDTFADALEPLRNERGGRFRGGTGSAMFYLWHSRDLGATPDGRRKGEWFGANYAPSLFARINGPLSVIQSFTRPHLRRVVNGGPLTMEFHRTVFEQPANLEKVAALVRLFVQRGGHQVQLNAVNREALLEAQRHPERFGNLIVRVWGWSAYFVELDRDYQDHVIRRQEYGC
jgi:formate C-acetyltransferase